MNCYMDYDFVMLWYFVYAFGFVILVMWFCFWLVGIMNSPHSVHKSHAGESEKFLREAFAEALSHAKSGKPSVIFVDEIDALCPRRDSRYERAKQGCRWDYVMMLFSDSTFFFMLNVLDLVEPCISVVKFYDFSCKFF